MMLLPAQLGAMGMEIRGWLDEAELEITGTLGSDDISDEVRARIGERMKELSREQTNEKSKLLGTPAWDSYVRERVAAGSVPLNLVASATAAGGGLDAMLASYLTGTWTAFETMAGDLWETTLNLHPKSLANLNGKGARFGKAKTQGYARRENDETRSIRLDLLQEHGFNVAQKMGTILRQQCDFSRLSGIRRAYASAFSEDASSIDGVLRDMALDALSAVRNLLVHKAGVIDSEYYRRAKGTKAPTANVGTQLSLDGEIVVGLIKPVINCGADLIMAVDTWLNKHK